MYVGFKKDIEGKLFESFFIGAFGTYHLVYPKGKQYYKTGEVMVRNYHYLNDRQVKSDTDIYTSKDLAFGIKLGFGIKL